MMDEADARKGLMEQDSAGALDELLGGELFLRKAGTGHAQLESLEADGRLACLSHLFG